MVERDRNWERLTNIVQEYRNASVARLNQRTADWPLDPTHNAMHEVVGGLLARQTTLAIELISGPPMWTAHIAPLVLRAMVEVHITTAWILKDPVVRSPQFIEYGLGQVKLRMEHLKARLEKPAADTEAETEVKQLEKWIDAQHFHFLTEVNIGSWSDLDLRKMAVECGCEDLYRFEYTAFSASTHSMWHHIQPFNLRPCRNPLHRGGHRVPWVAPLRPDLDYARRAASLLDETFDVFDSFRGVTNTSPKPAEALDEDLAKLYDETADDQADKPTGE